MLHCQIIPESQCLTKKGLCLDLRFGVALFHIFFVPGPSLMDQLFYLDHSLLVVERKVRMQSHVMVLTTCVLTWHHYFHPHSPFTGKCKCLANPDINGVKSIFFLQGLSREVPGRKWFGREGQQLFSQ